jgi:hypothetical protein
MLTDSKSGWSLNRKNFNPLGSETREVVASSEEATNMEPAYYVSYYLELQKQLAASKGSSQKPLLDVPADQELNSLRPWRFFCVRD